MSRASKTSRISPAISGCFSQYSRIVGRSPFLWRARKSSARSSTGFRSLLEGGMSLLPFLVEEAARVAQDVAQPFQGPHVAAAGGGSLDAEHLGRLLVGEFF